MESGLVVIRLAAFSGESEFNLQFVKVHWEVVELWVEVGFP